jgi:hypothetical protein
MNPKTLGYREKNLEDPNSSMQTLCEVYLIKEEIKESLEPVINMTSP